jgi:hypothetical protein
MPWQFANASNSKAMVMSVALVKNSVATSRQVNFFLRKFNLSKAPYRAAGLTKSAACPARITPIGRRAVASVSLKMQSASRHRGCAKAVRTS